MTVSLFLHRRLFFAIFCLTTLIPKYSWAIQVLDVSAEFSAASPAERSIPQRLVALMQTLDAEIAQNEAAFAAGAGIQDVFQAPLVHFFKGLKLEHETQRRFFHAQNREAFKPPYPTGSYSPASSLIALPLWVLVATTGFVAPLPYDLRNVLQGAGLGGAVASVLTLTQQLTLDLSEYRFHSPQLLPGKVLIGPGLAITLLSALYWLVAPSGLSVGEFVDAMINGHLPQDYTTFFMGLGMGTSFMGLLTSSMSMRLWEQKLRSLPGPVKAMSAQQISSAQESLFSAAVTGLAFVLMKHGFRWDPSQILSPQDFLDLSAEEFAKKCQPHLE